MSVALFRRSQTAATVALSRFTRIVAAPMKRIALLFAGQGTQVVGMGHDLAEQFPTAANLFREADEILGRELSEIAWHGPIEELTSVSWRSENVWSAVACWQP